MCTAAGLRQAEADVVDEEVKDAELVNDLVESTLMLQLSTSLRQEIQRSVLPCVFNCYLFISQIS